MLHDVSSPCWLLQGSQRHLEIFVQPCCYNSYVTWYVLSMCCYNVVRARITLDRLWLCSGVCESNLQSASVGRKIEASIPVYIICSHTRIHILTEAHPKIPPHLMSHFSSVSFDNRTTMRLSLQTSKFKMGMLVNVVTFELNTNPFIWSATALADVLYKGRFFNISFWTRRCSRL